jgi:hypothetical protein
LIAYQLAYGTNGDSRLALYILSLRSGLSGGCHLNRPIRSMIKDAGFRIGRIETGYIPGPKPFTFMYEGSARPG